MADMDSHSQRTSRARDRRLKRELGERRYEQLRAESWERMLKQGAPNILSAAERIALYRYTTDGDFVESLNKALREGDDEFTERHAALIASLLVALDRLPNYSGQTLRGIERKGRDFEAILMRYVKGAVVIESAFTSTTRSPDLPEEYRKRNVQFVIQSRSGKAVERWSADLGEREVLFKPGTRFHVDEVEGKGDKHIIEMTEVDDEEARQVQDH